MTCGILSGNTIRLLAVFFMLALVCTACIKANKGKITQEEQRALADAVMMLSLANEEVIRSSAEEVSKAELGSDPASYQGKWVCFDSEVVWVQGRDGSPVTDLTGYTGAELVYWIQGPAALKFSGGKETKLKIGQRFRAYGRVVDSSAVKMGLSPAGEQAFAAMAGGGGPRVAFFLAKWAE